MFLPVDKQLEIIQSGTDKIVTVEELARKLEQSRAQDKPLVVKLGVDPTAPDIHLGHTLPLQKLRQFQDLGHHAVLIIGDGTATIGDPSGRSATRPQLSTEEIERNARTYQEQAFKVLDKVRTRIEFNGKWFLTMRFADVVRLAARATVSQMLQREDFAGRLARNEPLSVHELLYPLMQGWDSVMIGADVELGGTDQLFNILVGRDLQKDTGQQPQAAVIMPILEGLDGVQKMSKSLGNFVGVTEPPQEMFGKLMSVSDELMWRYYLLLLGKTPGEIEQLKSGHPMAAKKALASSIVERFHSAEAAKTARESFEKQFSKKDYAEIAETLSLPSEIWIVELIEKTGKFKSRSDIRRVIQQGGVTLDGQKLTDDKVRVKVQSGQILKAGKLVVVKLTVA
jgi:tyrosyl-tRNA synthetase